MSVGVSIHVITGSPQDDEMLRCFFAQTLGSEYFNPNYRCRSTGLHHCRFHTEMMEKTWVLDVGEASWLSAAILGDQENHVPTPVQRVEELIAEPTEITQELVEQLEAAFRPPQHHRIRDEGQQSRRAPRPGTPRGKRAPGLHRILVKVTPAGNTPQQEPPTRTASPRKTAHGHLPQRGRDPSEEEL